MLLYFVSLQTNLLISVMSVPAQHILYKCTLPVLSSCDEIMDIFFDSISQISDNVAPVKIFNTHGLTKAPWRNCEKVKMAKRI